MSWRDRLRPSVHGGAAFRPFDYASACAGLARLDSNELPFTPDDDEMRTFQEELARLALNRYPDVSGRPLREALARRWEVSPDEILLGSGSEEIISILTLAFGAGDASGPARVLYPDPSFNQYEALARAYGAVPTPVPLGERFALDEARFADRIRQFSPALAFFASPNNPTGNRFDPGALCRLAALADAAFVVDEAYADFVQPDSGRAATLIPEVRRVPGLFVMRSLSKIGLAGLRVGALIGPADAIAELDKVRLPWNVNVVSLALACATLRHPERLERRVRETVRLRDELAGALRAIPGLQVYPSEANFLLVRAAADAGAVFQGLLARGILVKNVAAPGPLDRCLRITVGTALENARCVRAFRDVLGHARDPFARPLAVRSIDG
ncbi:MAG TPA: aminotransferase class I/II-fold pyridoxal phosphate-dependent enzyme [Polyangia bacterium]|nr:aminotransferase class I/II-fold pyridoxal phosphate-dependent enzyme [Polyangia bacterium]